MWKNQAFFAFFFCIFQQWRSAYSPACMRRLWLEHNLSPYMPAGDADSKLIGRQFEPDRPKECGWLSEAQVIVLHPAWKPQPLGL
jgi:hypothetical protein